MNAHFTLGKVTFRNVRQPEAPSERAATSSSDPWASMSGINERATKGKVTKIDASTLAKGVKMMPVKLLVKGSGHQSCAKPRQCSEKGSGQVQLEAHAPSTPLRPRIRTKMRPAMTGDTEKGRSLSAIKKARPLNQNLVTHQVA